MKIIYGILILGLIVILGVFFYDQANIKKSSSSKSIAQLKTVQPTSTPSTTASSYDTNPLSIEAMQKKAYPGSNFTFIQTLTPGANYNQYLVSYISDNIKIYGLLTIPYGKVPTRGYPAILFNHGYIQPNQYSTVDSYAIMVQPLASAGYVVFKPDYRGNGNSQGSPAQVYISASYITDSMNALSSLERLNSVNRSRIGVFGHSMGGNITLHELEITHIFKAAEIMAGVVGDEQDIIDWWNSRITQQTISGNDMDTANVILQMIKEYGSPQNNPNYWNVIDPTKYLASISTPVDIQVGSLDNEVPPSFSVSLRDQLQNTGKTVNFNEYTGADHNLEPDTTVAMSQAVAFFNKYLK